MLFTNKAASDNSHKMRTDVVIRCLILFDIFVHFHLSSQTKIHLLAYHLAHE